MIVCVAEALPLSANAIITGRVVRLSCLNTEVQAVIKMKMTE